jgi:hypothetical protein
VYLTLSDTRGAFSYFVAILYCLDPLFDISKSPIVSPSPPTRRNPFVVVVLEMSNRSCCFGAHHPTLSKAHCPPAACIITPRRTISKYVKYAHNPCGVTIAILGKHTTPPMAVPFTTSQPPPLPHSRSSLRIHNYAIFSPWVHPTLVCWLSVDRSKGVD